MTRNRSKQVAAAWGTHNGSLTPGSYVQCNNSRYAGGYNVRRTSTEACKNGVCQRPRVAAAERRCSCRPFPVISLLFVVVIDGRCSCRTHLDHKGLVLDGAKLHRTQQLTNGNHSPTSSGSLTAQRSVQVHWLRSFERAKIMSRVLKE